MGFVSLYPSYLSQTTGRVATLVQFAKTGYGAAKS
jgi:hypothetical protein